jgi:hypothetical protein
MVEAISYLGISDRVAAAYIEEHGTVSAGDVGMGLSRRGYGPSSRTIGTMKGAAIRRR